MTKPTFMRVTMHDDERLSYVDRRPVPPDHFWNYFFEEYSIADRGEEFHAEGMLALHDGVCKDFDGVFDLSDRVVAILKEMGYECPWLEEESDES